MGYSAIGKDEIGNNLCPNFEIVCNTYNTNIHEPLESTFKKLKVGKTYTLSWTYKSNGTSGAINQLRMYHNNVNIKTFLNGQSFEMLEDYKTIDTFVVYFGSNNTDGKMSNFMLNEGSIELPYEPYKKEAIQYSSMNANNEREAN